MLNYVNRLANIHCTNLKMSKSKSPEVTLSVKVTSKSAEGWKKFCEKNGVTLSAFIEVAGLELVNETAPPKVKARQEMIIQAREIDQKRRVRKR